MADTISFPPGPYTEEQLQMLERGWHGRPTMQTVVAEVRRQMALNSQPVPGWPCALPEPEISADGQQMTFLGTELSFEDAVAVGDRLMRWGRTGPQ